MERLKVDDAVLEYAVRGLGEPVLLIYPNIADGLSRPLVQQPILGPYRLISYHRRGYAGITLGNPPISIARQAADAAALLEHLGVDSTHVVGHSYGGLIALQLAADRPDLVHSLALLEPALRMVPSGPANFESNVLPAIARYRAGDKRGAVDFFLTAVSGPGWQTAVEGAVPGGVDRAAVDADAFFGIELPALQEWTFGPEQAARITQPVCSVVGAKSGVFHREGRQLLHSWFSQAEDFDLEGAGHLLQMENPEGMARGLAGFFHRHPMQPVP